MLKTLIFSSVIGTAAASAAAQALSPIQVDPATGAYLQDERGVAVRSESGLCWRGGQWKPNDSLGGCDGALVVPVVKATAPDIVAVPVQETRPVPAPAPTPVVVQAPVRCDFSVTLESDQSFEFNKVQLRPAAKKLIDNEILAKLLACAKVDLILVTGHADRLGAQRYNQLLSLRRAEAVASFLKNKHIAAKIETFGMGKTQSIKDCADSLPHKKLISCLAPNRRVTVEVRGLVKAR